MADRAPDPGDALRHLKDLSSDVRAAVLLDAKGRPVAVEGEASDPDEMGAAAARLLTHAAEAAGDQPTPPQLEVSVPGGTVYAASDAEWTIAVVAARSSLSSLMFYDLRRVLSLLEQEKAA
jgi:Roadblock/LC7 domain